jgi:hypothetical protein
VVKREAMPQIVRVYEKMRDGVWVFAGYFELLDAWQERSGKREVIKFKLGLKQDAQIPLKTKNWLTTG